MKTVITYISSIAVLARLWELDVVSDKVDMLTPTGNTEE